jgi:hypothetical protein
MILDKFRKKNQCNRTSDGKDINFRRWLSTEINMVFWRGRWTRAAGGGWARARHWLGVVCVGWMGKLLAMGPHVSEYEREGVYWR